MSIGATLANAMRFCGYDVFVEWIINDAGGQLDALGRSIYARYRQLYDSSHPFPDDGYPGEYLKPIAQRIRERDGDRWLSADEAEWLPYFSRFGRDEFVAEQRRTAERFGVEYDRWQSERELHEAGKVREGLDHLAELGLTYERDGALFFRATQFGDDKDRVLVRSDGRPTYLAMDVAYHYQKLRDSDRAVDILGPDHHGYIERLKGMASALGYPGPARRLDRPASDAHARERASLDEQARRRDRHPRRDPRRSRRRRRALLLRHAGERVAAGLRSRACRRKRERESGLLRAVRTRANRVGAAAGVAGGRAGRTLGLARASGSRNGARALTPPGRVSHASSRAWSQRSRRTGWPATRATSPPTFISFTPNARFSPTSASCGSRGWRSASRRRRYWRAS